MSAAALGDGVRDALTLAGLLRDCAASGVERHALHIRATALPADTRAPHHLRQLRDVVAPALRPTRARLFELPGGDLIALSPPPADHLEAARDAAARLLPERPAPDALRLLRLPDEAATLITAVEAALGLQPPSPQPAPRPTRPAAEPALEAALAILARADLTPHFRRRGAWRLEPDGEATPLWEDWRLDLGGLWDALLPGTAPTPGQALRLRRVAERRWLAALARPETSREAAPMLLSLRLPTLEGPEFLRFEGLLGALGRPALRVAVPLEDALAAPEAFARLRRWSAARGWALGLDEVPAEALGLLPLHALRLPLLRLRFHAALLRAPAEARAALEAALPAERDTVVLAGADLPAAVAWAWQRGITRFSGRMFPG